MLGGHLDSWIAGTGATDNGAGTVVAMEAVRILKALGVKPRRTIRIALWTGEEQGLFRFEGIREASTSVLRHSQRRLISWPCRNSCDAHSGPLEVKPEQKLISRLFQRRQRLGQDSRRLSAGQRSDRARSLRSGLRH